MELSVDEQRLKAVSDLLPEHHRRWNAGALASSLPHGGVNRVSQVLGISRKTVARGMREISQPGLIDATSPRPSIITITTALLIVSAPMLMKLSSG